jgi:hypothetical protein
MPRRKPVELLGRATRNGCLCGSEQDQKLTNYFL